MNQRWKHNLDITVMAAFLTRRFEFGRLGFEIFTEVWFWLYGVALMANDNLLRKAKRETWRY